MAYFDTVHNDSTFQQKALSERAKKLNLVLTKDSTPVSSWGRKHLFALRVLCKQPRMNGNLLFLECYIPKNEVPFDPCIQALVDGPGRSIQMLPKISESRFARLYNSELGGIWAALGALLEQRDNGDSQEQQKEAERRRPSRNRREPERLGNPIPTDNALFAFGIPKSDSSSSAGSVGYTENPQDPPVEDLTLRLVARFVRFVLIHGREVDNIEEPDVLVAQFRDKKLSTSYQLQNGPRRVIRAIDDGGVRLFSSDTEESPIVALMEAKRRFQNVGDGKPVVWDEVLAQMTGQALLALLDDTCRPISRTSVITIHATSHYMMFLSFECSPSYLEAFESLSPDDDSDLYFSVASSDWFDITTERGRRMAVRHILALVEWADDCMLTGGESDRGMDTE